ncbi:MAG TPA: hypothetical protein VEF34_04820 [Syntrophobacteraceae bacterium]|nr:hypothetical protein [Syntrophobacteraceae bacterium]
MKRLAVLSILLAVVSILSSSVLAATVDIAGYMGLLTPGYWGIRLYGEGFEEGFQVVKGTDGQVVNKWYEKSGSGWTFDSSDVFKVTAATLVHIGTNDGKDLWTFSPIPTIPRHMALNEAYTYSGVMTNQRTHATQHYIFVFVVTKSGLTVNTTAGTFHDCIQTQTYEYTPGQSRESTSLMGPGRADLKTWVSKIEHTSNPELETQDVFSAELTRFGNSNPPFP